MLLRVLGNDEAGVLDSIADGAFDHPIQLGIGRRLVASLVTHGAAIGCHEAWVFTSPDNEPAKRMYGGASAIPDQELSVMFTYRMHPREDDA